MSSYVRQLFVKMFHTEFHENPTNSLVDIRAERHTDGHTDGWTDRRTITKRCSSFLLRKKRLKPNLILYTEILAVCAWSHTKHRQNF